MLCLSVITAGEGREKALSSGGLDLIIVPGLGFTEVLTPKLVVTFQGIQKYKLCFLCCVGGESAWPGKGIGFDGFHIQLFDTYDVFFFPGIL